MTTHLSAKTRGFTLIELLIAMSISAILAVGTFYLVQATTQTRETLTAHNEYQSQLTRVMRTMATDLHLLAPNRPVRDAFGDQDPALILDHEGLRLTRNGWALSRFVELERSNLQRVSYRLAEPGSELCEWTEQNETGEEEGGCLVRSHWIHLDNDGRFEWRHQVLMRPVRSMAFRFLVDSDGQQEFRDEWPLDTGLGQNQAPPILKAVELRLITGKGDDITRLIRVPQLPAQQPGGANAQS